MIFQADIKIEVYDKNRKVVNIIEQKANSLVVAFISHLWCRMAYTAETIKDITGTNRAVSAHMNAYYEQVATATAGDDEWGIVVGTSNQAVSINDYNLIAKIASGSAAGNLIYSNMMCDTSVLRTGATLYCSFYRNFTNVSGNPITINEIGVGCKSTSYYYLLDRSLATVTINNLNSASITYKLSLSV